MLHRASDLDGFFDIGVGGMIILKWISGKRVGRFGAGFIWLRIGTGDGHL
jgi:hypothetical protein